MFNQRIARTLDRTRPAERAQASANQRRLAGAEVARQRHDHAAVERAREPRTRRFGRGGSRRDEAVAVDIGLTCRNPVRFRPCPRVRADSHARPPAEPDWAALAADIRRVGQGAGIPGDRHRGHRSRRRGAATCSIGSPRAATAPWIIWHGTASPARGRPRSFPGTLRVITARMNYRPPAARPSDEILGDPTKAFIARYALGRDYHKVLRRKLQQLAARIHASIGDFGYRVFTDSAPVLEVALAAKSGIGWQGKHTLLLTREAGSWFFLGEIYTDLPLPVTPPQSSHCGSCSACIDVCPTGAIVAPYELDARRCISYLTIELPRQHSRGAAAAHRQSRLRLRRLPALLPVEPVRAGRRRGGLRGAQRSRRRRPRHAVRVDRSGIRSPASKAARSGGSATSAGRATSPSASATRRRHPAHRRRARSARRRSVGARARARRVGARPARTLASLRVGEARR